jgi:hypothetical protein
MSKPSELAMHMLCKHMQAMTKFGMWRHGMFTIFGRILNLLFNIPKVLSIDILVLNCIKFQCAFYFGNSSFSTLKGEQNHGCIG